MYLCMFAGMLRDDTGNYRASFAALSALYVLPVVAYIFLIPVLRQRRRLGASSVIVATSRH